MSVGGVERPLRREGVSLHLAGCFGVVNWLGKPESVRGVAVYLGRDGGVEPEADFW